MLVIRVSIETEQQQKIYNIICLACVKSATAEKLQAHVIQTYLN